MSQDLVKQDGGSLMQVPDHLKEVSGHEGMELVRKQDLIIPRLGISQGNNPQMKRSNPLYIDGLKDGQFFNAVLSEVYGEKLQFIALNFSPSRVWFEELEKGGGILCRSFNGIDGGTVAPKCDACANSRWASDKPPLCTEYMNFPFVLIQQHQLVLASFKSTALKPTRTWLTKMEMLVEKWNKPLYAWVSEVELRPDKNDAGEFYVPTFSVRRWATAEEFKYAEERYQQFKGESIGKMAVAQEEKDQAQDEEELSF